MKDYNLEEAARQYRDEFLDKNDNDISKYDIEDEIEIPFGAKDSELQEETYYIPKGFHAEIDGDKVVIKKGCSVACPGRGKHLEKWY